MPDAYQHIPDGHIASFMSQPDSHTYIAAPGADADFLDWSNHASALFVAEHTDLALIAARRALSLARIPTTLLNLAVILETRSEFHSAFPLIREAYEMNPDHPFTQTLYSDALLRCGDFASAWPIYSRSHANWIWVRKVIPEWDGHASLSGKRILVLSGGGYGDNILFLRWMYLLKALRAQVTFMCPKTLHPLLTGLKYIDRLIAGSIAGLEGMLIPSEYDYYTCILSLGAFFCPTPDDIPLPPYLTAHPAPRSAAPLIGLCTQAGEEKFPRRHRTLNDSQTLRLLRSVEAANLRAVSLNYNASLPGTLHPPLRDWAHTASQIASLDLVITVDTAVAHLAGALNIPCWVMLPGISAAYYGVTGDNPFYPSQRLFRNGGEGIDNSVNSACETLEKR